MHLFVNFMGKMYIINLIFFKYPNFLSGFKIWYLCLLSKLYFSYDKLQFSSGF